MNKSLTLQNNQLQPTRGLSSLGLLGFVIILMSFASSAMAQCDFTMACNDGLQVSLEGDCTSVITPDMLLEGMQGTNADYTVSVMYLDGTVVPNATVTFAEAGDTLQVNVEHTMCQLACWGTIIVEDKLAPTYGNCNVAGINTVTIDCDENSAPTSAGGLVPVPQATDGCSGVTYTYVDSEIMMNCTSTFAMQIIRSWTATDVGGNTASCTQTININRALASDVVFPADYVEDLNTSTCFTTLDTLANGAPTPAEIGEPMNTSCPNLQVNYVDVEFELCGNGKKYLRTWTVFDWCSGIFERDIQVIKIEDLSPPVIQCGLTLFSVEIASELCETDFVVPHPNDETIVIAECSDWSYKISYSTVEALPDGTCPTDFQGEFFTDNVVFNNDGTLDSDGYTKDGTFTVTNLPKGCAWIKYTIKDECGRTVFCTKDVQIIDASKPTPACEGYTVISLDNEGWAKLNAETLDDGSWDNCGPIAKYEVRRVDGFCDDATDLTFGPDIHFCCTDIMNNPIKVELGVYDQAGNFNFCTVYVTVYDAIAPTLTCPANLTLTCIQDATDLTLTGQPTYNDLCGNTYPTSYEDVVSYNECGLGSITRTWSLNETNDTTVICTQIITVINNNTLSTGDVRFPNNLTISACSADEATPELLNSITTVNASGCSNIAISYTDEILSNHPTYCLQILRTWKVIDWCTFDSGNPMFIEKVQTININNNVAPTFATCANITVDADPGSCDAAVTLLAVAEDDCANTFLYYTWEVDANNDGTADFSGIGNNASGTYPSGTHKVTFTATDGCNNVGMCMYTFTINDNKPPTPICISDVVWVINEDGIAEIWASDFNIKSEDTCTPEDQLVFAFDQNGVNTNITFTCADIPNGVATKILLDMYVIDSEGNFDFCTVTLILQDSQATNACTDGVDISGNLSGRIFNEDEVALEEAGVQLANMVMNDMTMDMTGNEGAYAFDNVAFYDAYVVEPIKNDDALNGVSTLDLALIQKHILGLQTFESPFTLIAADINKSNSITAIDLIELRKLILGVYEEFPNNNSWRFMPTTHEFEDVSDPYGFPESVGIDSLYVSNEQLDFYAIKTGDVNKNAKLSLTSNEISSNRNANGLELVSSIVNGEHIVSLVATQNADLIGMQFGLSLDAYANVTAVNSGLASLNNSNYRINNNKVNLSWNDVNGLEVQKGDVLLSINVDANTESLNVDLDQEWIKAEAYTSSFELLNIDVNNTFNTAVDADDMNLTNTPNPFSASTQINFNMVESSSATLSIFDTQGRLISTRVQNFAKGANSVEVMSEDLSGAGVYYIKLDTGKQTAIRKMIVLQ